MIVPVDVDSTKPLYLQIADHITMLAVGGQLGGGTRLPASRQLAESLQVHRSTVVNAYEELKARGVIDATQGSGSYVVPGLVVSSRQAPAIMPALREPDDIVRMLWRVNRADGVISLALGLPADERCRSKRMRRPDRARCAGIVPKRSTTKTQAATNRCAARLPGIWRKVGP
ncbi:MAG: GntR family transcriptional regulator [Chloroflexi bacterium]|nr:GntR family transcriptional regulator [Chloroflexota bacterium]